MKRTILILSALLISTTVFVMATKANPQTTEINPISENDTQTYLKEFEKVITIPEDYKFHSVEKVKANKIPAYLFRFEKQENKGWEGEHFSFIISENKEILGYTNMDKKYANTKILSKTETENIAKKFLSKIDQNLADNLKNLWIERHDEEIIINGKKTILAGMKYKCYRSSEDDYTWVIVGFDGSIITFERNIKWNDFAQKRITEKWLHDNYRKKIKHQ
ncbi:MAG: hypothetical protein Q4G16_12415 [Cruoricaptor ignavus]|nr:hypothetical protein [Cruoricaptor ignavus]